MHPYLVRLVLLLSACACLLCGCRSENPGEEAQTWAPVEEPAIVFASREIKETEGDILLYRAVINAPVCLLPVAEQETQTQIQQKLDFLTESLLACPVDVEALRNKAHLSPEGYQTYERRITVQNTWIDQHFFSLLFFIETRGGGIGDSRSTVGLTMSTHHTFENPIHSMLSLSEEEGRALYVAAFEEDMQKNPKYYDDPSAGVRAEWVDQRCFCLTESGVMIWMPDDTVSLGASPILELNESDLLRLLGKGRMLHLAPPEADETQKTEKNP